ncbi:MAG: hypothetical protein QOJ35_2461, partial [Solirubrobacteraceae bacterium]|nr:hypothetical protein [Solirubrobacteraceae bacterium]
ATAVATMTLKTSADTAATTSAAYSIIAATLVTNVTWTGNLIQKAIDNWANTFTPSATGALHTGDTITITYTAQGAVNMSATPTVTISGVNVSNCAATGAYVSPTLTVTLTDNGGNCAIATGAPVSVGVPGVVNPKNGAATLTLKTSADNSAAVTSAGITIAAATGVTLGTPTSTNLAISSVGDWTIPFTTSAGGALAAGDTITVTFGGTGPVVPAIFPVALGAGFVSCSATGSGSAAIATITLADSGGTCSLPGNTPTSVVVDDVTNSSVTGATVHKVKTSIDGNQVSENAATLVGMKSVTGVTNVASPTELSARSKWTTTFTPSVGSGILRATDAIVITYASLAGFVAPAAPAVTVSGANVSNCSATAAVASNIATITLANSGGTCQITTGAPVSVAVLGLTNPSTATAAATLTVKTDVDSTAVTSANAYAAATGARAACSGLARRT